MFRGSIPGHALGLDHNRDSGHFLCYRDYFKFIGPLFPPKLFRRRFRMERLVLNCIHEGVMAYDDYFKCKHDALGKIGFSFYHKCTEAVRMLAYGSSGDFVDEYVRVSPHA